MLPRHRVSHCPQKYFSPNIEALWVSQQQANLHPKESYRTPYQYTKWGCIDQLRRCEMWAPNILFGVTTIPQQVRCWIQEEEPTSAWCLWETTHQFLVGQGQWTAAAPSPLGGLQGQSMGAMLDFSNSWSTCPRVWWILELTLVISTKLECGAISSRGFASYSSTLTGWFRRSVGVLLIGICHDDYQSRCTANVDNQQKWTVC